MTHSTWTRLALGFALLLAPAAFYGCAEEPKPVTPAANPAPAPGGDMGKTPPGAPEKK